MKWKATHILKADGRAPQRVMLNSGCLFTKKDWENSDTVWEVIDHDSGYTAGHARTFNAFPRAAATFKIIGETPAPSITPLRSEVTRICVGTTVRRGGKQRRLIVTLAPGDVLVLREQGCKTRRTLSLAEAWAFAGKQEARKLVRERREKRRARAA